MPWSLSDSTPRADPRRRPACRLAISLWLVTGLWHGPVDAEEPASEPPILEKTTAEGLHFEMPPDWPIVKRNGVLAPIRMEEYLSRKFTAVDAQLEALEQRLDSVSERLGALEGTLNKQEQLRSTEAEPE